MLASFRPRGEARFNAAVGIIGSQSKSGASGADDARTGDLVDTGVDVGDFVNPSGRFLDCRGDRFVRRLLRSLDFSFGLLKGGRLDSDAGRSLSISAKKSSSLSNDLLDPVNNPDEFESAEFLLECEGAEDGCTVGFFCVWGVTLVSRLPVNSCPEDCCKVDI